MKNMKKPEEGGNPMLIENVHALQAADAGGGSSVVPVLLGILAGIGLALAGWGIFQSKKGKGKRRPVRPSTVPVKPPAPVNTRPLAEQYYRLLVEVEEAKVKEAWDKLFLRYAPMFQGLLGLGWRDRQEGMPDQVFLEDVNMELSNFHMARVLGPEGFTVSFTPEAVDRDNILASAMKLDAAVLRKEIGKLEGLLKHYREGVDCLAYLRSTEGPLRQLIQAVKAQNAGECRRQVESLRQAFLSQGCYPLYAADPAVATQPGLLNDFIPESPKSTELPGLYFKNKEGKYALVGDCVGTRKEKH